MNLRVDLDESETVTLCVPGFKTPMAVYGPEDAMKDPLVLPLDDITTVDCELCAEQGKQNRAVYAVHSQIITAICKNHMPPLFAPPSRAEVAKTTDALKQAITDLRD